ncbi:MAG: DUF3784 domain-containing protein [Porcipelethomonas sp.]
METSKIILTVIIFSFAAISLLFSVLQFFEKGFLLNNAYLYASKEERKKMNKKPYYRQSSIVLLFLFLIFSSLGLYLLTEKALFMITEYLLIAVLFVYAIVSSILIEKSNKNK